MQRIFSVLLLAIAAITGGCSDIGKVNGVDISRVAGDNPNASYCQLNPTTCILGTAAAVGGAALIIHQATKDSSAATTTVSGGGGVAVQQ